MIPFKKPYSERWHLRAAASKYQTSPDSSKKSTSILFHKKNPYIELFPKMEFKRFGEFHFSRNREMSDFAQMGLGANPKIGKFCECWAASQSKLRKKNWDSVLYQVKVCHLGFLKKVSFFFFGFSKKFRGAYMNPFLNKVVLLKFYPKSKGKNICWCASFFQ